MKQARVNKIGKKSRTKANKSSKTQEKNRISNKPGRGKTPWGNTGERTGPHDEQQRQRKY